MQHMAQRARVVIWMLWPRTTGPALGKRLELNLDRYAGAVPAPEDVDAESVRRPIRNEGCWNETRGMRVLPSSDSDGAPLELSTTGDSRFCSRLQLRSRLLWSIEQFRGTPCRPHGRPPSWNRKTGTPRGATPTGIKPEFVS